MTRTSSAWILGLFTFAMPALAIAHISASGPLFAETSQEITFGVGHGCENKWDTYTVRVELPASVTSVRALPSGFGPAKLEKNDQGITKAVVWQRAAADLADGDPNYYKLSLRAKVSNQPPFTRLLFPTHQVCRSFDGATTKTVDWIGESEPAPDAGGPEPAPAAVVLPPRKTGWNKYTPTVDVADLKTYFGDALIVWKGNAAYSANPETMSMIQSTADVTALTAIQANDVVWVKY